MLSVYRTGLNLPAHIKVFAAFFLYAFGMGGFYPRLAEIQHQMGVSKGVLGLILTGIAAGTLVSLTFLAAWAVRRGTRLVVLWCVPCLALAYAVAAYCTAWPVLMFAALFLAGLAIGCIETVINLEADRIEYQSSCRIMNRAHAFWSLGFFGAGVFSAALSRLGWSPQAQLVFAVPLMVVMAWLLLGQIEAAPDRHTKAGGSRAQVRWASPTPGILLLVACCASALLLEGAGIDWSAIYMRDIFQSTASVGAMAVAVVAVAQAATRFIADALLNKWPPVLVARSLLLVLLLGTVLVVLATHAAMAMLGFAFIGVGSSAIFPMAMSAAAQRTDRLAALNVAALAQTGFIVFLLAPPILGWVAQHWGMRAAFAVTIPLVLLGLFTCSALVPGKSGGTNADFSEDGIHPH